MTPVFFAGFALGVVTFGLTLILWEWWEDRLLARWDEPQDD